jgi:hypothetical protein
MSDDPKRDRLVNVISKRRTQENHWAKVDFLLAHLFVWLAILGSFLTAILAAADVFNKFVLALFAAIPGTAIVVERSFSFAGRASWHWEMVAKLDQFVNELQFEDAKVEAVSKSLGEFRLEMETKYPAMNVEGLSDKPTKT